jgi:hypothetical protein
MPVLLKPSYSHSSSRLRRPLCAFRAGGPRWRRNYVHPIGKEVPDVALVQLDSAATVRDAFVGFQHYFYSDGKLTDHE